MKSFVTLKKLQRGDKVAVLSPSFAAPAKFPHVYELGLKRLQNVFGLEPVEYPTTKKLGASTNERAKDLIAAFKNPAIKAVISTIGGDDQITYIKHLAKQPFIQNPKPFFGYSDNTHFENFLWHCGIPSFYGGALFVQFAEQGSIHEYTKQYLEYALFENGEKELTASTEYNEIGLDWSIEGNLTKHRMYETNPGWIWDGEKSAKGFTWGGCLESIDELLRHNGSIPSLEEFETIVLLTETSEEIPSANYVARVYRALGERGILERVQAILVGRPKAWEFDKQNSPEHREIHRKAQQEAILQTIRRYNPNVSVIQNMNFGHTDPQIPMPYGSQIRIEGNNKKIFARF